MDQLFFEEVEVGSQIPQLSNKIDLLQLIRYAAVSWNFYLLHLDKEYAQGKGFKDANIPAPYFGAFMATMINQWTRDPGRLKRLSYAVKVMGFPGDTLTGRGTVVRKYQDGYENLVECDIWVENQDGVRMAPGSATITLPSRK
jgi:acyl dehydratase